VTAENRAQNCKNKFSVKPLALVDAIRFQVSSSNEALCIACNIVNENVPVMINCTMAFTRGSNFGIV
jgi:hypothetical protein